jgi:hypothetical protein
MTYRCLISCLLAIGFALTENPSNLLLAQERLTESKWKRGFHGFNLICDAVGLTQITKDEFENYNEKDSVLVVLGDLNQVNGIERYLQRGGAVLAASDQQGARTARLRVGVRGGIEFRFDFPNAAIEQDRFGGMSDCPVVSDTRHHPALVGVNRIVSNRPGIIRAARSATMAFLPPLQNRSPPNASPNAFIASVENRAGGRLLAVADQSIFTNQMIAYEDNDLFAYQSLLWLKGESREYVLVICNGKVQPRIDLSDIELSIPPPSSQEVIEALKNLPPSAWLDFGNSVAAVVEDQNMVNEFIHENMDQVPEVAMNRFFIFLFFGLICLSLVIGFVWQKKLLRQTASVVASQRNRKESKQRKSQESHERQWAAGVLLDSICIELADRRYNDWPEFPLGLGLGDDPDSRFIFRSMTKASNHFKSKPRTYWNRQRLQELEQDLFAWREFFHQTMAGAEKNPTNERIDTSPIQRP